MSRCNPVEKKYNPFLRQIDSREPFPYNISAVGWERDHCSVLISMRGTFYARMGEVWCSFGIASDTGPLAWKNHSGYLPCLVTTFDRNGVAVEISHFCNKVRIDGSDYSLLYSRVRKTNNTSKPLRAPADPSADLVRLTSDAGTIGPGEVEVEDFVTAVDSFGEDVPWPTDEQLQRAGSWDANFAQMRDYWDRRLSGLVRMEKLPDPKLADAWRAGTIYQLIIMDDLQLNVGVNAYQEEFSHDSIGLMVMLIQSGDLELARDVLDAHRQRLVAPMDYPDGDYKYSWPWALYLLKTGDKEFVRSNFTAIKAITRASANQATGPGGIMRLSYALDHPGCWLVDNWSMLTGLAAYRVICERLGEHREVEWATETYNKLFDACNKQIEKLQRKTGIDYIPCSMVRANRENKNKDSRNASWATSLHFGRWPWEGYMLGARQDGVMLDCIDATYDWGFDQSRNGLPRHSFGGWPGYCSSYNAGYAYPALRGERYRSEGIRAYQWMIENAMGGPYAWWEGGNVPDPDCPWGPEKHLDRGSGSCPHAWGDSFSRKILLNSLIDEFADGRVIIGRGIPEEWLEPGNEISISNVPTADGRRFGYHLIAEDDAIRVTFSGDAPTGDILIDLPGSAPSSVSYDGKEADLSGKWPVTIPGEAREVVLSR